MMILAVSHVTL